MLFNERLSAEHPTSLNQFTQIPEDLNLAAQLWQC